MQCIALGQIVGDACIQTTIVAMQQINQPHDAASVFLAQNPLKKVGHNDLTPK
jgi:hypothetical protein